MRKVLVLEDEANIRGFIVINLRRAGYEVIEAGSGEEALEKLKAQKDIRVALLDVMLPGIIYRPYSAFAARRQRMIRIRYGL